MTSTDSPVLSRYLRHREAAAVLGVSRTDIPNKVLAGLLVEVDLATAGRRRQPRITRESLDAYCARLEEEGRQRAAWVHSHRRV